LEQQRAEGTKALEVEEDGDGDEDEDEDEDPIEPDTNPDPDQDLDEDNARSVYAMSTYPGVQPAYQVESPYGNGHDSATMCVALPFPHCC
jgi:hypothetical protein